MASMEDGQPAAPPRIPFYKRPWTITILLAAFGVPSYLIYNLYRANNYFRALEKEKSDARTVILPALQAEQDQRLVQKWRKELEKLPKETDVVLRKKLEERAKKIDDIIKVCMKKFKPEP